MKPSNMLPTPLDGKPNVNLTELSRKPAGEGWEAITYQGEDGHRYEVSVKEGVERNWVLLPPMEDDK
jgi:hypothetical protein